MKLGRSTKTENTERFKTPISSHRNKLLPIWKHKEVLLETIEANQHCIIVSSTGSGKTTQLPQFLLEKTCLLDGIVAITQPRRVAAITVAIRVAEELGRGPVGTGPVGYCVRFEDMSNPSTTRLRYMTDGMLLREAILDPELSRYRYVILDEAHERGLTTDILFGVLLTAARRRAEASDAWARTHPGTLNARHLACNPVEKTQLNHRKRPLPLLKIIVMSATIDPTPFVNYIGPEHTKVVYIEGRPHPIKVLNSSQPCSDYVADAALTCLQIHRSKTSPLDRGILIFLTGEEEIMRCCSLIRHFARFSGKNGLTLSGGNAASTNLRVFPLFASLPQGKQLHALSFSKPGYRKVIVSTNVAETSITIPGIRYVIDCGFSKIRYWEASTGLDTFRVHRISKSQAWQRAGRAGREAPGVCLRLYTDEEYNQMNLHHHPEILRAPLAGVLLSLVSMGITNPQQFPWLSRPSDVSVIAGLELLKRLGAVISLDNGKPTFLTSSSVERKGLPRLSYRVQLTPLGSLMSAFPLDPRLSRVILSAAHLGCLIEVLTVISMLYVSPVFYTSTEDREKFEEVQQQFRHPDGDLTSLLQVYRAYLKSSKLNSSEQGPRSRLNWCRSHRLNRARLDTAIRVRTQLKQLVKDSCLASCMKSCGPNISCITRAFLAAGFHDQIAVLADPSVLNRADLAEITSRQPIYMRTTITGEQFSQSNSYFLIHPDSQLYLSSINSPPAKVLFIETAVQNSANQSNPAAPTFVYMRQVSCLPDGPDDTISSSVFSDWFSRIVNTRIPVSSDFIKTKTQKRPIPTTETPSANCYKGVDSAGLPPAHSFKRGCIGQPALPTKCQTSFTRQKLSRKQRNRLTNPKR